MPFRHAQACLEQVLEPLTNLLQQIQSSPDLDASLTMVTAKAREILASDRVLVYQLLPGGDGVVVAESVQSGWLPIQGQLIYDPCFATKWHLLYQQGQTTAIADRETANLQPCYLELLTRLQVQANLVVPVLLPAEDHSQLPELWGLLIAHQCGSSRQWDILEHQVLRHLAMQLGYKIRSLSHPPTIHRDRWRHSQSDPSSHGCKTKPVPAHQSSQQWLNGVDPESGDMLSLKAFDFLQNPVWVYDIEQLQMRWANHAALPLWNATSRDELLSRDFSDVSESTRIRLQNYLQQFEQGKTLIEQWTFYPAGQPVSVQCRCSGLRLESGQLVMLVEGTIATSHEIDQDTLRSIEALRHTSVMISLYTLEGTPLLQNPAALQCYGDTTQPNLGPENAFLRHFVDAIVGERAMAALLAGEAFSAETQVFTSEGQRWHGIEARRVNDPITGKSSILVNEKDITALKQVEAALRQKSERFATIITVQQDIALNHSDLDAVMALIVEHAQALTHATGSVIELVEGDELVYRAASGIATAFIGLRLNVATSFSGHCVATSQILHCNDVETEPRVDLESCHRIGVRSMVVVPLITSAGCIGVLKVFAQAPATFSEQDIQTLQLMAGFLTASIQLASEFESKNTLLQALRESEDRYRSVITVMAEGVVLQQADGQITACNASAEKILGLTQDQIMGRSSIDPRWRAIHADGSPFPGETHPAIVTLQTGVPQSNVIMGVHKPDDSLTWIAINSQPLFHPGQLAPYAAVTTFVDITAQKQAEANLRHQAEREQMISAIAQHIRESLDLNTILNTTVTDVRHFLQCDRVIIYRFNSDWSGVVVTESVAPSWDSILNMEIRDTYFVENHQQAYSERAIQARDNIYTAGLSQCHIELLEQLQVKAKLIVPIWQGDMLWGLLVAHHCQGPRYWQPLERELLLQLATQVEIAIQQSELYYRLGTMNNELERLATLDGLTQIANRRCFDLRLQQEWQRMKREQQPLSLLLLDVDYFKLYNDTYGHQTGDRCLCQVATAIQQTVKRSADLVARYGGEEFAVLLAQTSSDGAIQVAQAIRSAIQQLAIEHTSSAVSQSITVSIGIATAIPARQEELETLVATADAALYEAKRRGRNTYYLSG
ncbi:MAG TPA: diguanylate cyclase [Microcoleaceae cyanobacterium]|jgi:diguanylate cyclase (GGDEF)-like protein/PAS domain S-box-containing protein